MEQSHNSLNALADLVINSVMSGMQGTAQHPLIRAQVKQEIVMARNRMMMELKAKRQFDPEGFYQTIPKLPVQARPVKELADFFHFNEALWGACPQPYFEVFDTPQHPVRFIGPPSSHFPWRVLFGSQYRWIKHERYMAKLPTAVFVDRGVWILNPPSMKLKEIPVTAIFSDPRELQKFPDTHSSDSDFFPMPHSVADMVTNKLIQDYLRMYRLAHGQITGQRPIEE